MTDNVTPTQAGRFAMTATETLAAQCRMQARENLVPEYTQFVTAVADRLATQAAEIARLGGIADLALTGLAHEQRKTQKLREALEPFAKAVEIRLCGGDYWTDDKPIQGTDIAFHITFGDLRRAAALRVRGTE